LYGVKKTKVCFETQIAQYVINSTGGHHHQNVKIQGTNKKVLSLGTLFWNTKTLSHTIQKIQTKFLGSRSNFKVTRSGGKKIMEPTERSCHNEHTCEIWKPYHLPFKRYSKCEIFKRVSQTTRWRSGGKKLWYQ
jgi:hypothetical protein